MNFSNLMQESLSNDYNRLIELCSSYGLNEQQTNQIISDFKNGSFAHQDSIDESFQQSLRDLDSNIGEDHSINHQEEYSFKHHKNGTPHSHANSNAHPSIIKEARKDNNFHHLISNQDSFDHEHNNYGRAYGNEELMEFFMAQRKEFEKNIQSKLEQQNKRLKDELRSKEQTIEGLMKMKGQDSQIILGLKESVLNLTNMIQEKDHSYRYLAEKYEKIKSESECISTQKTSKVQLSQQQSLSSFEERKSLIREKEHCLTQMELSRVIKKSSQKYIKQISDRNSSKILEKPSIENRENRDNFNKNEQSKRSGVDISKYKGMIEKLRNSYQFR